MKQNKSASKPDFFSLRGSLKGKKKLSDRALEKAVGSQIVKEYLQRVARMKD